MLTSAQGQNRLVLPTDINLDKNRHRSVVFYGRVSTEHEAQISALENQLQWYDDQASYHKNWTVQRKYIDEGITGTQAKKRPAFLQMIEDAKHKKFDLIVTREVCRFARNTVDTLVTTRELKNYGVEVYFVEDNIWTTDGDGELRLTIMATLAQEESRKTSERVRAGQKISRDNGVLYGSGNILGYDRIDGNYVINEEQAETVRIIFELYSKGLGIKKIVAELTKLKRKDSSGLVRWECTKISRILHNATYKGYKCYLKSRRNNYLEQKRINNHDESTYLYVKGDFEPIISEELWEHCRRIRESRTQIIKDKINHPIVGYNRGKDVWVHKLVCKCGQHMRRNKWRKNLNGEIIYGYKCYNQLNYGSKKIRDNAGVASIGYCDLPEICDWKFELMAYTIFNTLKIDYFQSVKEAYKMYDKNYSNDSLAKKNSRLEITAKINKLKERLKNLTEMRMGGELTKEEFLSHKQEITTNIVSLEQSLLDDENKCNTEETCKLSFENFEKLLFEKLDFSKPKLDRQFLEQIIYKIVPVSQTEFVWYLNLLPHQGDWCGNGKEVCQIEIDFENAHRYRQMSKAVLRKSQWKNLFIKICM